MAKWPDPDSEFEPEFEPAFTPKPAFDLDTEADFEPLELKKPLARGKASDLGDVTGIAEALADLGAYDKGRHGNPPLVPETLFRSIEDFQKDQGLDVDGVMLPGGPTLGRINALLPKARPKRPRGDGLQSPKPAPKTPAAEDDDGPSFADLYKQRLDAGEPQGFGPAFAPFEMPHARVPSQTDGPRAFPAQASPQAGTRRVAPAAPGQPLPPPPREWVPIPGRREVKPAEFWDALRNDSTLGARAREAFDFFSHAEGGAAIDRSNPTTSPENRTFGGITRGMLDRARRGIGHLLHGVTAPEKLTNAQRIAILRYIFDTDLAAAGRSRAPRISGTQVIELIGNRPHRGARETAVAIVDMMLRWGGTRARPRIQAAINRLIARLGSRAPSTLHNHTALAGAFGERTLDAIIGLIDSGHGEALRQEIVNEYDAIVREEREGGASNMGDDGRVDALRNLRLPPIGSGP